MIVGVGIDVLHLPRLVKLVERQSSGMRRLANRILTDAETSDFEKLASSSYEARLKFLAVR
jgi:phosphopantetheinyl transferase (holo-ACP synthase)